MSVAPRGGTPPEDDDPESFQGTERYEVVRVLGSGGSGIVYEVIDRERAGEHVALKVLRGRDPQAALDFKREFQIMQGLRHENLVALYDRGVTNEGLQFFTMELIVGPDFFAWVRNELPATGDADTVRQLADMPSSSAARGFDEARLRKALKQLVQGVSYLHGQRRVHRDLKPDNVKVTNLGRAVILDFGLVKDVAGSDGHSAGTGLVEGTVPYMAPEQAEAEAAGPAADWYAVGVMLFQCLTGGYPFRGSASEVLHAKRTLPAPVPHEVVGDVPEDLDRLCVALLRRLPADRPAESEILEKLGLEPLPSQSSPIVFQGRELELGLLAHALQTVSHTRRPGLVHVIGASGIGKSSLVRQFTQSAPQGTVVLTGRCFEREAVPFKALDSLVDSLAVYLAGQPPERVDALLPRDPQAIARMFPVMKIVPGVDWERRREAADPPEQRRQAINAMRDLLGRMTDRSQVVIFLDDAQWGDRDSSRIFIDLMRPPDAPAILMVLASRTDVGLRQLPGVDVNEVALDALPKDVCEAIARGVLPEDAARANKLAAECGGNPYLLHLLTIDKLPANTRLEDVIAARVAVLLDRVRGLLEVIAVAASPVDRRTALAAAGLGLEHSEWLQQLKDAHLVKGVGERGRVETYHDKIRETVVRALSPERRREIHANLAKAMQGDAHESLSGIVRQAKGRDIDVIAWHLGAAGLTLQAAEATLTAAREADAQLTFERAALLYRRALDLLPGDDVRRAKLWEAQGDAFSNAGHSVEAVEAYARAVKDAPESSTDVVDVQRRAAEQLLRSGHIDEGLVVLRQVLGRAGMRLAKTPGRAVWALLWRRLRVAVRGLGFRERKEVEVPPSLIQEIDICWTVALGLAMVDTIRGASFQTRQLLLALKAGEPTRVARALAAEASFVATAGISTEAKAKALIARARSIATGVGDPKLVALIDFHAGLTRFLVGRWSESQQLSATAERQFREAGWTVSWEAATARLFSVWSLFYLGELAHLRRRVEDLAEDAERRGDLYTVASLKIGLANVSLLVRDDPTAARAAVREVMATWSKGNYHFQHYWALLSESMIDLYEDRAEDAWARLKVQWAALKTSQFLRIQNVRVEALTLRGKLALATGRQGAALADARRLEKEHTGPSDAQALLIRGLAAGSAGVDQLRRARVLFEAHDMALFANATRLRLAELEEGAAGEAHRAAALAWLRLQDVVAAEKVGRIVAPNLKPA